MSASVRLSISGKGDETDAPTVEDLLEQVRDYLDVLRGVESAIAPDGKNAIEWRIVGASRNSPLALDIAAFPVKHAMNVDRRALATVRGVADGLKALAMRAERPSYFTDRVVAKAERLFERVTNGLASTVIDHGPDLPSIALTPPAARVAAAHVKSILKPPLARPYREIGSVEGRFHGFGLDGLGRELLQIRHRLSGDEIKCVLSGEAKSEVASRRIGEVWSNKRLRVHGMVHFKSVGVISHVEATQVVFLRDRDQLPSLEEIEDESFTGGLSSEAYLAKVRDGRI